MSAKVKAITTTIEDTVVFMTQPDVQFVSLVKHGANRTPFKVLKHEKEDSTMKKVVQSILVKNDLPKEQIEKALEGMSKKSATSFKTFTSYPQLSLDRCADGSFMTTKHSDIEGVYVILADLKEGESEKGTLQMDAKEAIDYATLDNLYTELYAMADVVSGAMRQESAGVEFRKTTILTAIENFRNFAEVTLSSMDSEKADTFIDPKNHPNLLFPFIKTEKADAKDDDLSDEEKAKAKADEEAKAKADADASTPTPEDTDTKTDPLVVTALTNLATSLTNFGEQITSSLKDVKEEIKTSNETLKAEISEIANTTVASKTETEEDNVDTKKKEGVFGGVLFSVPKQ
jgi:hypothetical protein